MFVNKFDMNIHLWVFSQTFMLLYPNMFWEIFCFCLRRPSVRLSVHNQLVRFSQAKLLARFQPNFTGMISIYPSCAWRWHVPLGCAKWPSELKIEKPCLAFTGQTAGQISTKLHRNDLYTFDSAYYKSDLDIPFIDLTG